MKVLLIAVIVFRKSESLLRWLCVLCVTFGISIFMLSGNEDSFANNNALGLGLLALSLLLDGVTGRKSQL
jgi:drug/metabolite transporter (DMT)-like permease